MKEGDNVSISGKSFLDSLQGAIEYLPVTFQLTFYTFIFSLFIGTIIATIRNYKVPFLSQFFGWFVTIYNGLPLMVALVIYNLLFMTSYDSVARFFHISKSISEINPIIVGYFSLILSSSCNYSETIRGAFQSIEQVQYEAGYAIGLNKFQTLYRIILPQLVPVAIPGLINNLVGTIKGTNLVSAIGILEIMGGALTPCALSYSYLEGYLAAALVYWIFSFVLETLAKQVEVHSGKFRRQVV